MDTQCVIVVLLRNTIRKTPMSSGYGVDDGAGGHDVVMVVVWLFDNTKYYYQNK